MIDPKNDDDRPTAPPPPPEDEPAPSRRPESPPRAPSQRAGGRVRIPRRDSPPEGTPIVIERRGAARAMAGLCSAVMSSLVID